MVSFDLHFVNYSANSHHVKRIAKTALRELMGEEIEPLFLHTYK